MFSQIQSPGHREATNAMPEGSFDDTLSWKQILATLFTWLFRHAKCNHYTKRLVATFSKAAKARHFVQGSDLLQEDPERSLNKVVKVKPKLQ